MGYLLQRGSADGSTPGEPQSAPAVKGQAPGSRSWMLRHPPLHKTMEDAEPARTRAAAAVPVLVGTPHVEIDQIRARLGRLRRFKAPRRPPEKRSVEGRLGADADSTVGPVTTEEAIGGQFPDEAARGSTEWSIDDRQNVRSPGGNRGKGNRELGDLLGFGPPVFNAGAFARHRAVWSGSHISGSFSSSQRGDPR
jgi:hypothetical protein